MNKKVWNLYKQTEDYNTLVGIFKKDIEDIFGGAKNIFKLSKDMGDDKDTEVMFKYLYLICENFFLQGYEFSEDATREDFESFVEDFYLCNVREDSTGEMILVEDEPIIKADNYRMKNSVIDAMSTFMYYFHPLFKPMLLSTRFSVVAKSCEELGIELPEFPKVHDYKGAMMWYYDVCTVFNAFQKEYEMSDEEFCACLYGLGPTLGDDAETSELPKPVNVWLTGANKEDYKFLEAHQENDSLWACNENTRRGDIVVLYAVSPHSCIHSIWRADSNGTFNPFDYYQCRTRLTDGVKITPIKLGRLKADTEFSKLPMMNNNLQGINGKRLPSWAYSALLKIIAENDDLSNIPMLYESKDWNPGDMESEHDVEEKILIPTLHDLGYKDEDWTRQLRLKAGRAEKAIPDFVFFPRGEKHAENSPLVIEAKWKMSSEKERNDAYRQARSYAKMLESDILGICDEERLIIYRRNNNREFNYSNPVFEAVWASISCDEAVHDNLMQLIGAEVIKSGLTPKLR